MKAASTTHLSFWHDEDDGHSQAVTLIVDDNEINRDLLSRRLSKLGYRYAMAENSKHFDPNVVGALLAAEERFIDIRKQYSDTELAVILN